MSLSYIIKQKIYSQLLEQSDHGIFILDDQFCYVSVNDKFANTLGLSQEEIKGKQIGIRDIKNLPIEVKILVDDIIENLISKKYSQGIIDLKISKTKHIKANFKIIGILVAGKVFYSGFFDESKVGIINTSSTESLNYDSITNLPFRKYFIVQFGQLLLETMQEAVLVRLNFDRFRMLRSNHSSETVDILMAEFVQRVYDLNLQNLMLFSRFDRDDFALVFEVEDAQLVKNELHKIFQISETPFVIKEHTVYINFSSGVSQYPKDGSQVDLLIDNADKALQYVKEKGGDDVCWFTQNLIDVSAEKLKLETELRLAITQNQFFAVYQPKVDLATGKISSFEALVRWNHPSKGVKSPAYFLEVLLEYKLSFDLFCFMAEQVVKDLYTWQQQGYHQELCINADSYDFLHPQFIRFMQELLIKYPINQGSLHVEVTETSIMQQYDVDIIEQFSKLKALGVKIALDDFGTGYASISYLRHYPFDYIKIDKSFIDDLDEFSAQIHIIRAIIDLASALSMFTVAEGIETKSQAQLMYRMGCVVGQGYYFGKPMSYEKATSLVKKDLAGGKLLEDSLKDSNSTAFIQDKQLISLENTSSNEGNKIINDDKNLSKAININNVDTKSVVNTFAKSLNFEQVTPSIINLAHKNDLTSKRAAKNIENTVNISDIQLTEIAKNNTHSEFSVGLNINSLDTQIISEPTSENGLLLNEIMTLKVTSCDTNEANQNSNSENSAVNLITQSFDDKSLSDISMDGLNNLIKKDLLNKKTTINNSVYPDNQFATTEENDCKEGQLTNQDSDKEVTSTETNNNKPSFDDLAYLLDEK